MQHTLIAVFDNRSDAQRAQDELIASGFPRQEIRLSEDGSGTQSVSDGSASSSDASATGDTGVMSSIRHFFTDVFGTDRSEHADMYAEAVSRGHFVLSLDADSETEVERAADIVERFSPIDIDEHARQWAGQDGMGGSLAGAGMLTGGQTTQHAGGGMLQSDLSSDEQSGILPGGQGNLQGGQQGSILQSDASADLTGRGQSGILQGDLASGVTSPAQGNLQGGQQSGMLQSDPLTSQSNVQSSAQGSLQSGQLGGQVGGAQQRAGAGTAIPVIQEELKVGKREVQRGGVRIFQRVIETPVNETIGLREEHVNVERHAVDRPVSPDDLNAFQETTIEMRETAEEAVVEKTARVVEEVVVGKEVSGRSEQISDTVRRTEVEIEQLSPSDDAYFRGHWSANFANQGGSYEDYSPAYGYGSSMARSTEYGGRPWNDVESNLRSDWETRYPQSGWDKFKTAVRHGWDRMTS
ncbi:MAG TPA: YsnF/AvaK domain-containing protein [Telluria sp.]|jgi:uncharacterized protein (TIGR02271 family)